MATTRAKILRGAPPGSGYDSVGAWDIVAKAG
jgi:hypothetical protein